MIKQTIQASGFGKKTYAKPQIKAHQVKPMYMANTSPNQVQQTEEYQVVEKSTINTWFNN